MGRILSQPSPGWSLRGYGDEVCKEQLLIKGINNLIKASGIWTLPTLPHRFS